MNKMEPLRRQSDIKAVKRYLKNEESPRNYLIFVLGITTGLRTSDLLSLRVKNVRYPDGKIREGVYLRESKTNKEQNCTFSQSAIDALEYYFDNVSANQDDWLFPSRTHDCHIGRTWVWKLFKRWVEAVGLDSTRLGPYSMRKTHGFYLRKHANIPLEIIQAKFNHASPSTTMRYIGITDSEVSEAERKINI